MGEAEDPVVLRPAREPDRDFIAGLSAQVFRRFGPYEDYLPGLMDDPWVHVIVAELEGKRAGFAMCAMGAAPEEDADLIAIATGPAWQRRGIGRRLLLSVEDVVASSGEVGAAAVRLTVAEDNLPARRFFESAGYEPVPGEAGVYPAGQRSITMRKRL